MADQKKPKAPGKKKEKDVSAFDKIVKFINQDKIIGREPEGITVQKKREKDAGI